MQHAATIEAFETGTLLKETRSICPSCLEPVEARVYERGGEVWMDKTCPSHGEYSALLARSRAHYYLADPRVEALGSCCGPSGCGPSPAPTSERHQGDQVANHSCNLLFEITQRCNLTCPTCYAGSSPTAEGEVSLEEFEQRLDGLLAAGKGDADLIQLSGGEPTIHPQFFEILEAALSRPVRQIYVNTNGIKLAQSAFAERLASYGERVNVYLQFDGFKRSTLRILRGREDLVETKLKAADQCERLGLCTVPVMTLTPDVNDDELGAFFEFVTSRPRSIHKVMIQPAMYSGRYEQPRRVDRMTVADVVERITAQVPVFNAMDFSPIPCSDPNCFSMALALRAPDGLVPVSRLFPRYTSWAEPSVAGIIGDVTDTFDSSTDLAAMLQWALESDALAALDEATVDQLLDRIEAATTHAAEGGAPLFAIGIKPFMDAYTYDQDRIDKCCVHIVSSSGEPVSFCEYNAIRRPRGQG